MFSSRKPTLLLCAGMIAAGGSLARAAEPGFYGYGNQPTPAQITGWNIDVRGDDEIHAGDAVDEPCEDVLQPVRALQVLCQGDSEDREQQDQERDQRLRRIDLLAVGADPGHIQ